MAWLGLFFLVPIYYLGETSLSEGTIERVFTWAWYNYRDAITDIPGAVPALAQVRGDRARSSRSPSAIPLAYWIAFRAARWRNLALLLVIAPFFVTYLIRTLAWQNILADEGPVVDALQALGILEENGRLLATNTAVVAGVTYNFLPFMILPLYVSLEQIDRRLLEAAQDLYASSRRRPSSASRCPCRSRASSPARS